MATNKFVANLHHVLSVGSKAVAYTGPWNNPATPHVGTHANPNKATTLLTRNVTMLNCVDGPGDGHARPSARALSTKLGPT